MKNPISSYRNQAETAVSLTGLIFVILILQVYLMVGFVRAAGAEEQWRAKWEQTVAKAKAEGVIAMAAPPGTRYRRALTDGFQKEYPSIKIEYFGGFPVQLEPRILTERRANRFLWDVYVNGPPSAIFTLKTRGALEPILPAMILPEVRDEKSWVRGFKPGMGFADKTPPFTFFMFDATVSSVLFINRSVVKKSDFNSLQDLLDPGWKGKIVMDDPRREGPGVNALSILAANYGKDFVRRLLTEQEVVFTRNRRQIAEWLLRGRYPLAIAVSSQEIADFKSRGIGKHVERFKAKFPVADTFSPGFGAVALFSKAPHSNAAKVYLNWLLSKKGQRAWAKGTARNSRRADVPAADPAHAIDEHSPYMVFQNEENMPLRREMGALAKKVYKR